MNNEYNDYNKDNEYDVVDSVLNQVYLDNYYLKEAWGNKYVDNNNKLRSSFKGNIKTLYSGNDEDKARITCDEFIRNNPKFYFVDYKQIYKE